MIDWLHGWIVRLWYRVRGPNYPFGPDDPAADERAAAQDAPTAEPDSPAPSSGQTGTDGSA